ncbi:MAG: Ig-like domain-containing protein [Patescibacteria group bacterium]
MFPKIAFAETYFYDTFTGNYWTNIVTSHTPETGTGWTQLISNNGGSLMLHTNLLGVYGNASNTGSLYVANGTYGSADYEVSVNLAFAGGDYDYTRSLAIRVQDANNMYLLRFSSRVFQIYKRVSGNWTLLGSGYTYPSGNTSSSPYTGDKVTLRAMGNTISALINDVEIFNVTDSDISATGQAGVGIGYVNISTDDSGTGVEIDNFFANSVVIDSTAPSVSVTLPISSEATSSVMTLLASASDETAMGGVSFYIDGILQGSEDTSSPYSMIYDTTATTTGNHSVFAVARDNANNYATSTTVSFVVDNIAPSVSLTSPTTNEEVSGSSVALSAGASDSDTSVAGVNFYINNILQGSEDVSSPYSISWDSTATTSGAYTGFAVARDSAGNYATSTSVSFTVVNTGSTPTTISATGLETGATITWNTATTSSSKVYFGLSSDYSSSTPESNTSPRVLEHSVTLTDLIRCTTYHYKVESISSVFDIATSSDTTFMTTGCTGSATVNATGSSSIATSTGGSLTQGNLSLSVPVAFTTISGSLTFQANELDADTFSVGAGTPSGYNAVGSVYNLKAFSDATTTVSSFDSNITVTMSYTTENISGIDESTLWIYRYDGSSWHPLSGCSVDTSAKTVTCTTGNFSDFSIFGQTETISETPSAGGNGPIFTGPASALPGYVAPRQQIIYPDGRIVYLDEEEDKTDVDEIQSTFVMIEENKKEFLDNSREENKNICLSIPFERNLRDGSEGEDVKRLQEFLNCMGFEVAKNGAGLIGNETIYFAGRTKEAVIRFQEAYREEILTPFNLEKGTGVFANYSRQKANDLIK